MEVKIGVTNTVRELTVDVALDASDVEDLVAKALSDGGLLTLTDHRGRKVMVPVEKLGYIEIATATVGQVGFRG